MQCPNCGGERPEIGKCPYCDTLLLRETPEGKKLPPLDPSTIPMGKYKGVGGFFELREVALLIRHLDFETVIPYDQLVVVYYRAWTSERRGKLAVRWIGNQYLPFPLKTYVVDITSVFFTRKQEKTFHELYCFLKAVAERNQIKVMSFEDRQAQLDSEGIAYCPQCLSTQFSAEKQGFSLVRGIAGNKLVPGVGMLMGAIGANDIVCECPYCGHVWRR